MSSRRENDRATADELTRRRFLGLGLSGAVLLGAGPTLLSACGGDDGEPKTGPGSTGGTTASKDLETVKIGVISTYTGIAGFVGDITKRSLISATKYLDQHGIGGRKAKLVERDIAGADGIPSSSLAVQAVQEFVDDPDIIGILWCAPVNGLADVLADVEDAGIPFISVFADLWSDHALYPEIKTAENLPDAFKGLELRSVFQVFLPDRMAVDLLADYCKQDRKFASAGMIHDTVVYPNVGNWWKDAMDRVGLEQAGLETFTMFESEYGQQVQRLQAAGGDALFVWGLSSNTAGVVKQISAVGGEYVDRDKAAGSGWAPQIMGSPGGTGERGWVDLAGKTARPGSLTVWYVGGLVGLPDFPIRDMMTAAGYDFPTGGEEAPADALAALLRAAEEADGTDPDAMVEALESGMEIQFAAAVPFSFTADRHLSKEKDDLILITLERAPEKPPYKLGKEFGTTFPADYEGPVSLNDFTAKANQEKFGDRFDKWVDEGYGTSCTEERQGDEAKAKACSEVH